LVEATVAVMAGHWVVRKGDRKVVLMVDATDKTTAGWRA